MNRRSFLLLGAATCVATASAGAAPAGRQPKSTLTVNVLSVDREEVVRHEYRSETFKTGERSNGWSELTRFVAKAKIAAILNSEVELSPGSMIEFRWQSSRGSERPEMPDNDKLSAGETRTLTLFRGETSFWWRGS